MWSPQRLASCVIVAVLGAACVWMARRTHRLPTERLVVAITGCDSGIGYSAALHCHNRGLTVVAMVLNIDSSGAQDLARIAQISGRLEMISVDVTKPGDVLAAEQRVNDLLNNNKNLIFHGLINNAGVMVFGETEWQTEHTISMQLDVNLKGAIMVTKLFAPLLRKYKGRVMNVTSHCSSLPLPGLSVYAASKAGLQAWSDALRVEWNKYNITVISLIPGAFFQQTNILSRQNVYAQDMHVAMSEETKQFYGRYYHQYQSYLSGLAGDKPAVAVQGAALYKLFDSALLDPRPQAHYHDTPWRYSFYHSLAAVTPTCVRDKLVTRFTAMPPFDP